ncbi:MAG TPA: NADPH-dependent FMN reductase [Candidatus Kapabacteria bacterium]|nr:NADPH-dependent FMN reductase [Candidatus Kapabacteria bacterium]
MHILAISGSLRAVSSNTNLLRALADLASPNHTIRIFDGLAELPAFNPDIDTMPGPEAVERFRAELRASHGVIFSTPEYAHGVPGSLKNALDWVVGSGELVDRPVAIFNASPRSTYALASLTETLSVMSTRIIAEAGTTIQLMGRNLGAEGIAADPEFSLALRAGLEAFTRAIEAQSSMAEPGTR